jgi:hypothetical protein
VPAFPAAQQAPRCLLEASAPPQCTAGTTWVAQTRLRRGERAVILPGGLRDAYGETNGAAFS